jgi:dienelactone hydrolase
LAIVFGRLFALAAPDLQQPPSSPPEQRLLNSTLTKGIDGKPIASAKQWEQQRSRIKEQWHAVLGQFPDAKPPLNATTLSTEVLDDFTRSYVKYQAEDGVYTDGYLLLPKRAVKKSAAVVVFHPTTPLQAKGVAGVDLTYEPDKRQGVQLVKRGFIVWCPRNCINAEGADWAGNARRVAVAHPQWTGMTRMVWEAIRAADYLESLPQVDSNRIGCLGHSLGAKVVLYAMAFDERYKAGVFSEGGIGLSFSNWDAPWYLGPKIREKDFTLENDQVLASIAPRAFLLLAGDSADSDRSWAYIKAALSIYALLGVPKNIGWWNHHRGHAYPPEARAVAEEFLEKHLGVLAGP